VIGLLLVSLIFMQLTVSCVRGAPVNAHGFPCSRIGETGKFFVIFIRSGCNSVILAGPVWYSVARCLVWSHPKITQTYKIMTLTLNLSVTS